jgi:hypothetical protein
VSKREAAARLSSNSSRHVATVHLLKKQLDANYRLHALVVDSRGGICVVV